MSDITLSQLNNETIYIINEIVERMENKQESGDHSSWDIIINNI